MDAKDCDAVLHVGQDYELTLISAAEQAFGVALPEWASADPSSAQNRFA